MEFKFDTKPNYTLIIPLTATLNVNLTEELAKQIALYTNQGANNFIIDLQNCTEADNKSFGAIAEMHGDCYMNDRSLVFTGVQQDIAQSLKEAELADLLNIAPTLQEAADIISMEILERDLLGEE